MNRVDQRKLTDLSEVCCNPEDSEIVQEMLVNDGDYFGRKLSTNVSVPGNPHKVQFREFWISEIKPSSFILDTIEYGYKLPFSQGLLTVLRRTTRRLERIKPLSEQKCCV